MSSDPNLPDGIDAREAQGLTDEELAALREGEDDDAEDGDDGDATDTTSAREAAEAAEAAEDPAGKPADDAQGKGEGGDDSQEASGKTGTDSTGDDDTPSAGKDAPEGEAGGEQGGEDQGGGPGDEQTPAAATADQKTDGGGTDADADADPFAEKRERLSAIDTEIKALRDQYDRGELDFTELDEAKDALRDEATGIRREMDKAEIQAEMEAAADQKAWDDAQSAFFTGDRQKYYNSPALFAALNVHVQSVGSETRFIDAGYDAVLVEAEKRLNEELGITAGKPATPSKEDAAATEAKARAGRPTHRPEKQPTTLGDISASEGNAAGEDRFAALDKLSGVELEEALAKLSPKDVEAYLGAGGATH